MNFTVTPAASQEILAAAERSNAAGMAPVSYTHLTLPTSDLV